MADFGLTKASGEKSLTRTGQFVGTFDYISPEQIKGERATKRSDVYALAAVLYECLSGLVPFPKDSEAAVLYAHMAEDAPKLTEQRPELPATLDEVIAKGMAKDPAERYESGGSFCSRPTGASPGAPGRHSPHRGRSRRRRKRAYAPRRSTSQRGSHPQLSRRPRRARSKPRPNLRSSARP